MLSEKKIIELFEALNEHLKEEGEVGEVGIVGGAVMCLVFKARPSTRDVDGIFEPTRLIRKLAEKIGKQQGVGKHWLNDGAKAYIQGEFKRNEVLNLSHLRIWSPEPQYMLAMKCLAARWDTSDRSDVEFLIRLLKLNKPKEVFKIIENFYPKRQIPPKTQFLIEEIFSE